MPDGEGTKPAMDRKDIGLSKDDLLKYIELDLWSKFQERLWKVVGIFLTLVTVVGLLGVPYYIKSEVNTHLQQREKEFTDKTNAIFAYSKLLSELRALYASERYRFDGDVLRVVAVLAEAKKSESPPGARPSFQDPDRELVALISRDDFAQVVEGSFMSKELFAVPQELKDKPLVPATVITVENTGLLGSGGYQEIHPVRDGTYGGIIRDLRYRILVLEVLRRSINDVQRNMLALGGSSALEKRVEEVRVSSLESSEFLDSFSKELTSLANIFLTGTEQEQFSRVQQLYVLGYHPGYVPPKSAPQIPQKSVADEGKH